MTEPPTESRRCACAHEREPQQAVRRGRRLLTGDKAQCGSELSASDITGEVWLSAAVWCCSIKQNIQTELSCVWLKKSVCERENGRIKWKWRGLCCVYNENIVPVGPFGLLAVRLQLKRPSTQPVSFLITSKKNPSLCSKPHHPHIRPFTQTKHSLAQSWGKKKGDTR